MFNFLVNVLEVTIAVVLADQIIKRAPTIDEVKEQVAKLKAKKEEPVAA